MIALAPSTHHFPPRGGRREVTHQAHISQMLTPLITVLFRPILVAMVVVLSMHVDISAQSPYAHLDLSKSGSMSVLSESYISCGFMDETSSCYCIEDFIESFSSVLKFELGYDQSDQLGMDLILDGTTYSIKLAAGQILNEANEVIFDQNIQVGDSIKIGYYEDRVYYMFNDVIIHDKYLGTLPSQREVCLVIDHSSTERSYYAIQGISVARNGVHFVQNTLHPQEGEQVNIQVALDLPNNSGQDYVFQIRPMDATAPHFDGYDYIELRIAPGETLSNVVQWTIGGPNEIADTNHTYHFDITSMTSANLDIDEREMLTVMVVDDVYSADGNLNPGEIVFIGFDNDIGGDVDRLVISNFVDLQPGTEFQITNARYLSENGVYWESFNPSVPNAVPVQTFTYVGSDILAAGSVICMDIPAQGVTLGDFLAYNLTINGASTTDFEVTPGEAVQLPANINMPIGSPSLLFITQGVWGLDNGDRVVMSGSILDALPYGIDWVTSGPVTDIQSNIPTDLDCFVKSDTTNIFDEPGSHWGYFDCSTIADIVFIDQYLDYITDYNLWEIGDGDPALNLPSTICEPQCDLLLECEELIWTVRAEDLYIQCGLGGVDAEVNYWLSSLGGVVADCACGERDATVDITYNLLEPLADLCLGGDTRVEFVATDDCGYTIRDTSVIVYSDDEAPRLFRGENLVIYCNSDLDLDVIYTWLNDYAGVTAIDDCLDLTWTTHIQGSLPSFCPFDQELIPVTFTVTDYCGNEDSITHYIQIVNTCFTFDFSMARSDLEISVFNIKGCDPDEVVATWEYRPLNETTWTPLISTAPFYHVIEAIGEYQVTLICDSLCTKTKSILYDPPCEENVVDFTIEFDGECLTIIPDDSGINGTIVSDEFYINGKLRSPDDLMICGCDLYDDFNLDASCSYNGSSTTAYYSSEIFISTPEGCNNNSDFIINGPNGPWTRRVGEFYEWNPNGTSVIHLYEVTQNIGFFDKATKAIAFVFTKIPYADGCPSDAVQIFRSFEENPIDNRAFDRYYRNISIQRKVTFEGLCPPINASEYWSNLSHCQDAYYNGQWHDAEVTFDYESGDKVVNGCNDSENALYVWQRRVIIIDPQYEERIYTVYAGTSPSYNFSSNGEYRIIVYCDGCKKTSDWIPVVVNCDEDNIKITITKSGDYLNVSYSGCPSSITSVSWYANGDLISVRRSPADFSLYLGHSFVPDYGEFCVFWNCEGCIVDDCITVNYDCSSLSLNAIIISSSDGNFLSADPNHNCSDPNFNVQYTWKKKPDYGGAESEIVGSGSIFYPPDLTVGAEYKLVVKCGPCSKSSAYSYVPPSNTGCNKEPSIFPFYPDGIHTLNANLTGCNDPNISYQWAYLFLGNWLDLGTNELQVVGDNGRYRVTILCDLCTYEAETTICASGSISVSLSASGSSLTANVGGCSGSPSYSWYYRLNSSSAESQLFTSSSIHTATINGEYRVCVACDGCDNACSAWHEFLDCTNQSLSISIASSGFDLTATSSGCPSTSTIAWYKEGQTGELGSGANYTASTDGCYYATVTCDDCDEQSNTKCLTICDDLLLDPSIDVSNGGALFEAGTNHGCDDMTPTFDWYQKLDGETVYSLYESGTASITPDPEIAACYKVMITCGICTALSAKVCNDGIVCEGTTWSVDIEPYTELSNDYLKAVVQGCPNASYLWEKQICGGWYQLSVVDYTLVTGNGRYRVTTSCLGCPDKIKEELICDGLSLTIHQANDILSFSSNGVCTPLPSTVVWRYRPFGSSDNIGTVKSTGSLEYTATQSGEYIVCATCCEGCTGCSVWKDITVGSICTPSPSISIFQNSSIIESTISNCSDPSPTFAWYRKLSTESTYKKQIGQTGSSLSINSSLEASYYATLLCDNCPLATSNILQISCISSNPGWTISIPTPGASDNYLGVSTNCTGSKSYEWRRINGSTTTTLGTGSTQLIVGGGRYEVTLDCDCLVKTAYIDICDANLGVSLDAACVFGESPTCQLIEDRLVANVSNCSSSSPSFFWEFQANCTGSWGSHAVTSINYIDVTKTGCYRVTASCFGCGVESNEHEYTGGGSDDCSQYNLSSQGLIGGIRLGALFVGGVESYNFVVQWDGPTSFTSGRGSNSSFSTYHGNNIVPVPSGTYTGTIKEIGGNIVSDVCIKSVNVNRLECSFASSYTYSVSQDNGVRYIEINKPVGDDDVQVSFTVSSGQAVVNGPGIATQYINAGSSRTICILKASIVGDKAIISVHNASNTAWSANVNCASCSTPTIISLSDTTVVASRSQDATIESDTKIIADHDIHLYPNPAQNILNLEFTSTEAKAVSIQIYDPTGKNHMLLERGINQGKNLITLDVKDLGNGAYFLRMVDLNDHIVNKKFVIIN